jgi:hypothetical protein
LVLGASRSGAVFVMGTTIQGESLFLCQIRQARQVRLVRLVRQSQVLLGFGSHSFDVRDSLCHGNNHSMWIIIFCEIRQERQVRLVN